MRELADGVESLVESMIARLWEDPDLIGIALPERREASEQIARSNLGHEIAALRAREQPASCPPEAAEAARAAVAFNAPVTVVLQCYRAGHAVLWDAWTRLVDERVASPDAQRELLHEAARFMFEYVDRCSSFVQHEYQAERERVLRRVEQRRAHTVRSLVAGEEAELEGLDYPLEMSHLAAVAEGADAEETLQRLASLVHPHDTLLISVDGQTCWAWYAVDAYDGDKIRGARPRAATVGLGGPAAGVTGFRAAHQQARRAQAVAAVGSGLALYDEVALEALVLVDREHAHAFVAQELGALAADDARSIRLRATLSAYFDCGHNAASTAAMLGVHERTVFNRLRAAERALGHPPPTRRAELELALRLHRLFRSAPGPSA